MIASIMIRRQQKQIMYAAGFLLVLCIVVGLPLIVISLRDRSAAPPLDPPAQYLPLSIEQVDVISQSRSTDIVARLYNPNPRAGLRELPLTFIILDDTGEVVYRQPVTTYITPGGIQYAIALNVPVRDPSRVEVELPSTLEFTDIPAAVVMPSFSVFLREKISRLAGNLPIEEQKGIVRNTGSLDWQRVEITGLALGQNGQVVGVGQTFVGELKTGEQREFTLQWPAPSVAATQVTAVANTNIYREENIVKIIGDPTLLR